MTNQRRTALSSMVLEGAVVVLLLLASHSLAAGRGDRPPVPDFTKGAKPDQSHDWTLGPTGARGWVWGYKGQTTDARQILITAVAEGSPAQKVLQVGDVILGVNGKPFDDDARIQFARAITHAEEQTGQGILRLIRWRQGAKENVEIKLPILGTYSATAPYDCMKSRRIVQQGCQAIARQGFKNKRGDIQVSIANDLNALALLASGQQEYKAIVAEYARKVAEHTPGGHISWGYGYDTLFLAEYAAATRDPAVMPGLKRLSTDIARGASAVGTWGHSFARPSDGILDGYGCMNQPGIVLTMAMVVSREAGVKDPDLDRSIAKASGFLRWYVNKGAIPYGDHDPWPWHDDNGKCSSGAVLFDLLGDREATSFFSRMGAAAYNEREAGHTGNFFNLLWALPGVSRCGPIATGAYFKEQAWYYDLARGWDGAFIYPGIPADWGGHQYKNWDCTGAYLLAYALPLKSLYITGKKPCSAPALSQTEVAEVIAAGRDFTFWTEHTSYDGKDTADLFKCLSSWSPAVRKRAGEALSHREGDFAPRLIQMLASPSRDTRYGAAEALGFLGPRADSAALKVRALLKDPDPWIRELSAVALVRMGPEARKAAVPDLLRAAAIIDPADRRKRVQGALAEALFSTGPGRREPRPILAGSLDGVDRALLYAAVRDLLKNEDGRIRGLVAPIYPLLSRDDTVALLPDIVLAIQKPAISGEMFAYGIRFAGLDLLARLHIREGMGMSVDIMNEFRWGRQLPRCIAALSRYGGAAKEYLPHLKQVREKITAEKNWERNENRKQEVIALDKLIAQIESDSKASALVTMQEFIRGSR